MAHTECEIKVKGTHIERPSQVMKLEKDPFPSNLCSHILYRMDPSRPPGIGLSIRGSSLMDIMHIIFLNQVAEPLVM